MRKEYNICHFLLEGACNKEDADDAEDEISSQEERTSRLCEEFLTSISAHSLSSCVQFLQQINTQHTVEESEFVYYSYACLFMSYITWAIWDKKIFFSNYFLSTFAT